MCLAIPGLLEETFEREGLRSGKVNFGGIKKTICLEYTPDAQAGNYVLVHVGFAISVINEAEANRTADLLRTQADDVLQELSPEEIQGEQ